MKRRIALLAVVAAPSAIALLAAAFVSFASGSPSSPGPYGSTAAASAPNGAAAAATVETPNSPLGRTVIDGKGRMLYPFEKDKQNGRSAPDGRCVSGEATYAGHPAPGAALPPRRKPCKSD